MLYIIYNIYYICYIIIYFTAICLLTPKISKLHIHYIHLTNHNVLTLQKNLHVISIQYNFLLFLFAGLFNILHSILPFTFPPTHPSSHK